MIPIERKDNLYITLSAQMGDAKSYEAVGPHLTEMNRLLERYCDKKYCVEVDEFDLALRVDGDLWYFNFEGCEKLRLSKKYRYVTIDIGMPRSKWEGVLPIKIRGFLINHTKEALVLIINRLKKEAYPVNDTALWEDFMKVENDYILK